jgi:hypothetical protein
MEGNGWCFRSPKASVNICKVFGISAHLRFLYNLGHKVIPQKSKALVQSSDELEMI